jgi:hypothetical protein
MNELAFDPYYASILIAMAQGARSSTSDTEFQVSRLCYVELWKRSNRPRYTYSLRPLIESPLYNTRQRSHPRTCRNSTILTKPLPVRLLSRRKFCLWISQKRSLRRCRRLRGFVHTHRQFLGLHGSARRCLISPSMRVYHLWLMRRSVYVWVDILVLEM